jgi:hypothetical protein
VLSLVAESFSFGEAKEDAALTASGKALRFFEG